MPPGSVIAFAGEIRSLGESGSKKTNLPMFNWLLCDGREVTIAQYPVLFAALGYRYGGSKGCFKLPDYQGMFLRGVGKDDASVDNRKGPKHGGENSVGSSQQHALEKHKHSYQKPISVATGGEGPPVYSMLTSATTDTTTIDGYESSDYLSTIETRPINTFVYWLIKTTLD
jgi:microcystin-dependent protein